MAILEGSDEFILISEYNPTTDVNTFSKLVPTDANQVKMINIDMDLSTPVPELPADFVTKSETILETLQPLDDDTLGAVLDYFPAKVIRNYLI